MADFFSSLLVLSSWVLLLREAQKEDRMKARPAVCLALGLFAVAFGSIKALGVFEPSVQFFLLWGGGLIILAALELLCDNIKARRP